jgi:quercetin dioxygenase-like cupin family protein
MLRRFLLAAVATTTLAVSQALAAGSDDHEANVTLVYEHPLPNVPGKSLVGVLVEYGPGGSSAAHRHPSSAFIYATVVEGAIASRVNDGAETVYRSGQNFSENPGDRHAVSRNASATKPAKLLAVFVVDSNERVLVLPY